MSLRDAGAEAQLSPSFISELERGETEIAITRLMRLADVYGVSVSDLLSGVGETTAGLYVPSDECRRTVAGDDLVEILYPPAPRGFTQPFRLILHPGAVHGGFVHANEEFHHCIQGRPRITVGEETIEMRPGDTVFVPANEVHAWDNSSRPRAVLVGAVIRTEDGMRNGSER